MKLLNKIEMSFNEIYNRLIFIRAMRHGIVSCSAKLPTIRGRIHISNLGELKLGGDIRINSGRNYNVIGGSERCNLVIQRNAVMKLGNNVGISNSTIVASKSIIIEDDVRIGGNVKIYDTDFHSVNLEERLRTTDRGICCDPIKIGEGAFIGAHSIILKGVVIGKRSVIGAGSVVTKSIPDNEIWGGNPAKFLKKL